MTREVYIAIALGALAVWLLVRHVRGIIRGGSGCGCCKGACRPGEPNDSCPSAPTSDQER
jgi:hypothetical protein